MKNKYMFLGIITFLLIIITILFTVNDIQTRPNGEFIYVDYYDNEIVKENYIFTDYNNYYEKMKNNVLIRKDFEKNNYALIPIYYDSCSESNITPVRYTIDGNDINVLVTYKASCGGCAGEYMYYLLKLDKSITHANINIEYKATNNVHCDMDVSYKPLIYLYPKTKTNVTVKVGNPTLLTSTYPKYDKEWNVIAEPNGNLIDKNGRIYYGLYWEGQNNFDKNYEDGFVVNKEEIIPFLEEKLSILGLTEKESNEFIIYWLPKLEENEYNLIRFENLESINEQMSLDINPTPDTLIRIFMKYKPLKNKIEIKEQELSSPVRNGFTVVEWGGSLIK